MTTQASAVAQSSFQANSSTFSQTLAALILGGAILFAVGFAPMSAAHNAAHDTRHALAFPCH